MALDEDQIDVLDRLANGWRMNGGGAGGGGRYRLISLKTGGDRHVPTERARGLIECGAVETFERRGKHPFRISAHGLGILREQRPRALP